MFNGFRLSKSTSVVLILVFLLQIMNFKVEASGTLPDWLEKQVRYTLGKSTGELTQEDFDKVTRISGICSGITDIGELSRFTNLTELSLSQNQIIDISILSSLTKLTVLDLSSNKITKISALSGLKSLMTLRLDYNQITDIGPINNLPNLKDLTLNGNQITNIGFINSPELENLYLWDNKISSIGPDCFNNMRKIKILGMRNNNISDISAFNKLVNVEWLDLGNNQVSDISPLSNLSHLTDLRLNQNKITSIRATSTLSNLENLDVCNNQITEVGSFSLGNLVKLRQLWLFDNQITDISSIKDLSCLRDLYLNNNQINDISSLNGLPQLRSLHLKNNKISSVSIKNIPWLSWVDLSFNQINEIKAGSFKNWPSLQYLILSNNQITDFSFKGLSHLTSLSLDNNKISNIGFLNECESLGLDGLNFAFNQIIDISPLATIKSLNTLSLCNNKITDISPLSTLTTIRFLYLSNNRITDFSPIAGYYNKLTVKDFQLYSTSATPTNTRTNTPTNTSKDTPTPTPTNTPLPPKGNLEYPTNNQSLNGEFILSGWFLDRVGVSKIEVLIDGVIKGQATYGTSRSDVDYAYPWYFNGKSGFYYRLDTRGLTNGEHTVIVRETGATGVQTNLPSRNIIVSNLLIPMGYLDFPTNNQSVRGVFNVHGWFLDGVGVSKIEVLIDGLIKGQATYGTARADVKSAYPTYNNEKCGFYYNLDTNGLTIGEHTIVISETGKTGVDTSLSERKFIVH